MDKETSEKVDISSEETVIEIVNMNKWYGDFHVLKSVSVLLSAAHPDLANQHL